MVIQLVTQLKKNVVHTFVGALIRFPVPFSTFFGITNIYVQVHLRYFRGSGHIYFQKLSQSGIFCAHTLFKLMGGDRNIGKNLIEGIDVIIILNLNYLE